MSNPESFDQATRCRRSLWKMRVISREINLAATSWKPSTATLPVIRGGTNPALRGLHERRRAGLLVFRGFKDPEPISSESGVPALRPT
jgi:hypothetical protein